MAPKTRAKSAIAGEKDPNPKQTIESKLYINTHEDDSKNTKRCGASVRSEDKDTALQDTANAAANVFAELPASADAVDPQGPAKVLPPAVRRKLNGRRRRTACSERSFCQCVYTATEDDELEVADFLVTEEFRSRLPTEDDELEVADFLVTEEFRSRLPTEDDELEVADFLVSEDFRSRWATEDDELEVAGFLVTEDFRCRRASRSASVAAEAMVQLKKDSNYSSP